MRGQITIISTRCGRYSSPRVATKGGSQRYSIVSNRRQIYSNAGHCKTITRLLNHLQISSRLSGNTYTEQFWRPISLGLKNSQEAIGGAAHVVKLTLPVCKHAPTMYVNTHWTLDSSLTHVVESEIIIFEVLLLQRVSPFHLLIAGIIVTVIAFFIEDIFDTIPRLPWLKPNQNLIYGQTEWQAQSTLQLQRTAHENLGLGTWKGTKKAVPVMGLDETLGLLDVSDRSHARLVKQGIEMDDLENARYKSSVPGVRNRVQYLRAPSNDQLWSP